MPNAWDRPGRVARADKDPLARLLEFNLADIDQTVEITGELIRGFINNGINGVVGVIFDLTGIDLSGPAALLTQILTLPIDVLEAVTFEDVLTILGIFLPFLPGASVSGFDVAAAAAQFITEVLQPANLLALAEDLAEYALQTGVDALEITVSAVSAVASGAASLAQDVLSTAIAAMDGVGTTTVALASAIATKFAATLSSAASTASSLADAAYDILIGIVTDFAEGLLNALGGIPIVGTAIATTLGWLFDQAADLLGLSNDAWTDAQTGITNAAAAQSTANTGVTNAAAAQSTANTAVTNAATAQSTADTAKALLASVVASGSNIVSNPGFESTSFYVATSGAYDTAQTRSGTRSMRLTGNGSGNVTNFLCVSDTALAPVLCAASNVYYVEGYVRGKSSNVQAAGGAAGVAIGAEFYTSAGALLSAQTQTATASTALNGVWTKISGYITAPASAAVMNPIVRLTSAVSNGEIYYFDDVRVVDVTDAYNANAAAAAAASAASAAQTTANTGVTNAATAQTTANTANTTANNAYNQLPIYGTYASIIARTTDPVGTWAQCTDVDLKLRHAGSGVWTPIQASTGSNVANWTAPPTSGWTTLNTGSGIVITSNKDSYRLKGDGVAGDAIRGQYRAISTSGITFEGYMEYMFESSAQEMAMYFLRRSASGKFVTFGVGYVNSVLCLFAHWWNSSTSFNSIQRSIAASTLPNGLPRHFKIVTGASDCNFFYSVNGDDWLSIYNASAGNSTFLGGAPDGLGMAIYDTSLTQSMYARFRKWYLV